MIGIKKNYIKLFLHAMLGAALLAVTGAQADDEADANSLPVPRFVSLKSGDVNMRVGPGTRYSINWVYKHENLPVEVIQEFDQWREVRDADGTTGWVHKQMLQGKRTAIIKKEPSVLHRDPDAHSAPMLRAEVGVVGWLLHCKLDWCEMQIAGRKGWIEKTHIWGAYTHEEF